ncbi:MAG: HTH domain-containing protein [Acidobacteriota bacterium]|nr:HTH domain-containing protein [Acidobacteriota bacterium]
MAIDNENLIATLEQSLRQMRQSRSQKMRRLREIEGEVESLRQEIQMLDASAKQIETTMHSLLFSSGSNRNNIGGNQKYSYQDEMADYEMDDMDEMPPRNYASKQYAQNPYAASRSVVPMRNQGGGVGGGAKHVIPPINPDTEVRSHRFADRTITQACTILMREAGRPLHVNELYNRLLENGFNFTGNNPTISIAVSLNRNRRFRKVAPGTFDLVMRDASQAVS